MTDNKRFKVAVYDDKAINGFTVLDLHKPNSSMRLEYENVYIGSKEGCEIVCKFGNNLADETEQLKHIIQETYKTERTALGKSVLKQILDNVEGIKWTISQ